MNSKPESRNSKLILASSSPRRQELLRAAAISFEVQPAQVDEAPHAGEPPATYAERLAQEKAKAVFATRPNDVVLGADTVVVLGEQVMGKPVDADDAARMLRHLSGRTHHVTTGVCLVGPGFEDVLSETTQVTMSKISEEEIAAYVASGEPMDKAGAYAIQGVASRWISKLDGCYFNVVGLPVPLVYRTLRQRGLV